MKDNKIVDEFHNYKGIGFYEVGEHGMPCDDTDKNIRKVLDAYIRDTTRKIEDVVTEPEDLNEYEHIFEYDIPEGSIIEVKELISHNNPDLDDDFNFIVILIIKVGAGNIPFNTDKVIEGSIYYSTIEQAFGSGNIKIK